MKKIFFIFPLLIVAVISLFVPPTPAIALKHAKVKVTVYVNGRILKPAGNYPKIVDHKPGYNLGVTLGKNPAEISVKIEEPDNWSSPTPDTVCKFGVTLPNGSYQATGWKKINTNGDSVDFDFKEKGTNTVVINNIGFDKKPFVANVTLKYKGKDGKETAIGPKLGSRPVFEGVPRDQKFWLEGGPVGQYKNVYMAASTDLKAAFTEDFQERTINMYYPKPPEKIKDPLVGPNLDQRQKAEQEQNTLQNIEKKALPKY